MDLIKDGIIQVTDIFGVPFKYDPIETDKTRYPMTPTTATIHNTANPNADEHDHTEYVDHTEAYTDWHFTVGDEIIYQEQSVYVNAWHATDGGSGQGNRTSIAIELDETGDWETTRMNAIKLLYFLKMAVPTMKTDFVRKHQDWKSSSYPDGKYCPRIILGEERGWQGFLDDYNKYASEQDKTPFYDIEGHWGESSIKKLIRTCDLKGYPDGTFRPDEQVSRAELAVIVDKLGLTQ